MTLIDIYAEFSIGSRGFIRAIQTNAGLDISDQEIERIAARARTAEEFEAIWSGEDWWTDANNQ